LLLELRGRWPVHIRIHFWPGLITWVLAERVDAKPTNNFHGKRRENTHGLAQSSPRRFSNFGGCSAGFLTTDSSILATRCWPQLSTAAADDRWLKNKNNFELNELPRQFPNSIFFALFALPRKLSVIGSGKSNVNRLCSFGCHRRIDNRVELNSAAVSEQLRVMLCVRWCNRMQ